MRTIRVPFLPQVASIKKKGSLFLLPRQTRKTSAKNKPINWSPLGGDSLSPQSLFVVLPLPPSINHQYATVNGRRVLASKGRQYKIQVAQHLQAIVSQSSHRPEFFEHLGKYSLSLSIRFLFKTALRRDLDGGLKIAQDAICQAIGLNDNRITEIHLFKGIDRDRPRMECTLSVQALMVPASNIGKSSRSLHHVQ